MFYRLFCMALSVPKIILKFHTIFHQCGRIKLEILFQNQFFISQDVSQGVSHPEKINMVLTWI